MLIYYKNFGFGQVKTFFKFYIHINKKLKNKYITSLASKKAFRKNFLTLVSYTSLPKYFKYGSNPILSIHPFYGQVLKIP